MLNHENKWEKWNSFGGPRYPFCPLVQYVYRLYGTDPTKHQNLRVLDLGCGSGVNTLFFAENGFDTYACDISENGLQNTIQRLDQNNLKATLSQNSAYPENYFDFIACIQVIECIGSKDLAQVSEFVENAFYCLKTGGHMFFYFMADGDFRQEDQNPYDLYGYTRQEVEEIFGKHTFTNLWIDSFTLSMSKTGSQQCDWLVSVEK